MKTAKPTPLKLIPKGVVPRSEKEVVEDLRAVERRLNELLAEALTMKIEATITPQPLRTVDGLQNTISMVLRRVL